MKTSALVLMTALALPAFSFGAEGIEPKVAFDRLKTLEGTWNLPEHDGHPASTVTYRLTGKGSALMETMMPGTDHEMISMYHLDHDDLILTHFCAAGNQPRLKFDRKASTADHYAFTYMDGTNLDPAKDFHIHAGRFDFRQDGTVDSEWDAFGKGKWFMTSKFAMTRAKR